jgi:hypothetical protein
MKLTNDCKNIIVDTQEFKHFYNQENVDKIEVYTQYNCCENLEKVNVANLKGKAVPIQYNSNLCGNILEYWLRYSLENSLSPDEQLFLFEDLDFCCADKTFSVSGLTEEEILNGETFDCATTYNVYYIQRNLNITDEDLFGESETENIFNIGENFQEQANILINYIGQEYAEFGGVKNFEGFAGEIAETLIYAKEFNTFNGQSLIGIFNKVLLQDYPLGVIGVRNIITPIFRKGLYIVCAEKCGKRRIVIGNRADVEAMLDNIFEAPLSTLDTELYGRITQPLSITYQLTDGVEFVTSNIADSITVQVTENNVVVQSIEYLSVNTFRINFNIISQESTAIGIAIDPIILNIDYPMSITLTQFNSIFDLEYTVYLPIFDSEFITTIENSILINFGLFEDTMLESLIDGIYKVTIVVQLTDGTVYTWYNCTFVNCTTPCLLAKFMVDNLGKPIATELAMIHHSLVQADNCPCICDDMCVSFEYLWSHLSNIQIPSGCGC